ncbi:kinase-like domain-containing protein [Trichoderma chlorosporum]
MNYSQNGTRIQRALARALHKPQADAGRRRLSQWPALRSSCYCACPAWQRWSALTRTLTRSFAVIPNRHESSANRHASIEKPVPRQQNVALPETATSKVMSAPQLVTEAEETNRSENINEPKNMKGTEEDSIPVSEPDAVSEDIEEGRAAYRFGGLHPTYIGDIFNNRYKVLNKLGYGQYSTVWLVRDLQVSDDDDGSVKFRALKVLRADCYGHRLDTFEREILKCLRDADHHEHLGHAFICHLIDDFEHQGPNGTHVCFVFELMGETLYTFGDWFRSNGMIPYGVIHRFAIQLVLALDFAHCHNVIHTDIKPDNIFVKFRDYSLIESGYLKEIPIPQQDRKDMEYRPVPSQPLRWFYFTDADVAHKIEFDIVLGDWGVSSWSSKHLAQLIQPRVLRAPEVIIGAPWDASTDWWNLGAVLLEVYRGVRMFRGRAPPDGHYEPRQHLIEIIDLFGPFPKGLLEKGNQDLVRKLFNDEGRIIDAEPLDRPGLMSENFTPGLDQFHREHFVSFLHLLMKIDPQERPSAMDLLRHPWLGAVE